MREEKIQIKVDGSALSALMMEPRTGYPGVIFVHGWAGSQERDRERAREIAQLGCICLTFDLRGHGETPGNIRTVTREQNLADLCAAYDRLIAHPGVDRSSIAVIGSSYGAYLAALMTARRPVRWMALRVPALYRDNDWEVPKFSLDRDDLARYRSTLIPREENRALQDCQRFTGDVLIVESDKDEIIPHTTIASYLASFLLARSVTYRVIEGADHALSDRQSLHAYNTLLLRWFSEMVFGAR